MKLTSLTIQPQTSWNPAGPNNPLRAVVKLNSDNSTVECVLSEDTMRKMLDLCAAEIAANAERNIRDFVAAVTAIDDGKSAALLTS
jgi:hypothetical protein